MSLDGIVNICSISKTFTTTATTMQLWEKGLIDLNADINEYLDFEIRNPGSGSVQNLSREFAENAENCN